MVKQVVTEALALFQYAQNPGRSASQRRAQVRYVSRAVSQHLRSGGGTTRTVPRETGINLERVYEGEPPSACLYAAFSFLLF